MSSVWKNNIEITIFGESHGKAIGVVIGNFPCGVLIDESFIENEMKRRRPGMSDLSTSRKESDQVEIMSGVVEGVTTGAPIMAMIYNEDVKHDDYTELKDVMRPGHSDYSAYVKYQGFNDVRGGGHFSGRLTAPIVFAGALCKIVLLQRNIEIVSHIKAIGSIEDHSFSFMNQSLIDELKKDPFPVIHKNIASKMIDKINEVKAQGDSIGGQVECTVLGLQAGLGEPFFESMESKLANLMFSIPGVKGLHFGNVDFSKSTGTECIDGYCYDEDEVTTTANHNGGIVGGITNGMPVTFTVSIKPTTSIAANQNTINVSTKQNTILALKGRHDPCIVPRAYPVVEAMTAICILDSVRYL